MIDPKYVEALEGVHDYVAGATAGIAFEIADEPAVHIVTSLATMLELASGSTVLARAERYIGIPILYRSTLEAFVDLQLTVRDRAFVHSIEFQRLRNAIRQLKQAKAGNPYFVSLLNLDIEAELAEKEQELAARKDAGGREWKAIERWTEAGMEHEYESMFRILSGEAHNDGGARTNRHLVVENERVAFVLYRGDPPWVRSVLLNAPRVLYKAGDIVCTYFGIDGYGDNNLEALMDQNVKSALAGGEESS